jgi:hypothetical protein
MPLDCCGARGACQQSPILHSSTSRLHETCLDRNRQLASKSGRIAYHSTQLRRPCRLFFRLSCYWRKATNAGGLGAEPPTTRCRQSSWAEAEGSAWTKVHILPSPIVAYLPSAGFRPHLRSRAWSILQLPPGEGLPRYWGPWRNQRSIAAAASRPLLIARTTNEAPLTVSPAANTHGSLVW